MTTGNDVGFESRAHCQLPRYFRWFSGHCVLRQIDASDAARIEDARSRPGFASCRGDGAPPSEADALKHIRDAQAEWMRGARYAMSVIRRQSHAFVGWIELRSDDPWRACWTLDWHMQAPFVDDGIATEAIAAAADLMFSTLGAHRLLATCPRRQPSSERMLNDAGFIELAPAGSLDADTRRPRETSLFELGRADWVAIRREQSQNDATPARAAQTAGATRPRLELTLV
jgi:RimJ/RimL family protein N-acetyltransferase